MLQELRKIAERQLCPDPRGKAKQISNFANSDKSLSSDIYLNCDMLFLHTYKEKMETQFPQPLGMEQAVRLQPSLTEIEQDQSHTPLILNRVNSGGSQRKELLNILSLKRK